MKMILKGKDQFSQAPTVTVSTKTIRGRKPIARIEGLGKRHSAKRLRSALAEIAHAHEGLNGARSEQVGAAEPRAKAPDGLARAPLTLAPVRSTMPSA